MESTVEIDAPTPPRSSFNGLPDDSTHHLHPVGQPESAGQLEFSGQPGPTRHRVTSSLSADVPVSTAIASESDPDVTIKMSRGHRSDASRFAPLFAILALILLFGIVISAIASAGDADRSPIASTKSKAEAISQPRIGFSGDMNTSMARFWAGAVTKTPPPQVLYLPVPKSPPRDPYEESTLPDVGRISIPTIGLSTTLHQGVSLTSIDRGPALWPGSANPGGFGNMVIAGHRVTHSKPFRNIDQLVPGDRMYVSGADGFAFTYEVTSSEIVTPQQMSIISQPIGYEATIFACHPPGSADFRYVVHLRLLGGNGQPVKMPEYKMVHT